MLIIYVHTADILPVNSFHLVQAELVVSMDLEKLIRSVGPAANL